MITEIQTEAKVNDEVLIKLKFVLDRLKVNHKIEILKQQSLKEAHMYCKMNGLSGQETGPLIEKYIKNKYNMTKNRVSDCNGDLNYENQNFELKVSTGGKENNKFNYVQLRMNHDCKYYILTAYYLDYSNLNNYGDLFIFKLNKEEIKQLILKYGHYAHGTKQRLGAILKTDLDDINNNCEYALRPKYNDRCWKNLLEFRIDELCI